MNEQLKALIQQYERETGKKAKISLGLDFYQWSDGFVEWLVESFMNSFQHMGSQIKSSESRPTCGKEQRLFLDEVEKKGKVYGSDDLAIEVGEYTQISQSDFESDIEKVIKGK